MGSDGSGFCSCAIMIGSMFGTLRRRDKGRGSADDLSSAAKACSSCDFLR